MLGSEIQVSELILMILIGILEIFVLYLFSFN